MAPASLPARDGVTVLRALDREALCKQWARAPRGAGWKLAATPGGQWWSKDYDLATWFSAETVEIAGARDLADLLAPLSGDPHACVIRTPA